MAKGNIYLSLDFYVSFYIQLFSSKHTTFWISHILYSERYLFSCQNSLQNYLMQRRSLSQNAVYIYLLKHYLLKEKKILQDYFLSSSKEVSAVDQDERQLYVLGRFVSCIIDHELLEGVIHTLYCQIKIRFGTLNICWLNQQINDLFWF